MRVPLRRLVFTTVFMLSLASPARGQHYQMRHYSSAEGLPQVQALSLFQDQKGYLWVGTYGGVARYDGADFRVFGFIDGLSNNSVTAIAEDASGRLLFGTLGGVSVLDGQGFRTLKGAGWLPHDAVRGFAVDSDDTIWVATDGGLSRIRGAEATFYGVSEGLPDRRVLAVVRDSSGRLWAGTAAGLAYLADGRFQVVSTGLPPRAAVRSILEDAEGNLWLGTEDGLFIGRAGEFRSFDSPALAERSTRFVYDGVAGADGELWFATQGGVLRVRDGQAELITVVDGLPDNNVWQLLIDREGSIWFGTDNGLAKYVPGPFYAYTRRDGLPHNFVRSIEEDPAGRIWLSTRSGVGVIEPDGRIWSIGPEDGLTTPRSYAATPLPDGSTLIGTDGGLFVWRDGIVGSHTVADGLPSNVLNVVHVGSRGDVWLAFDQGLGRWVDGRFETMPGFGGFGRIAVEDIAEDAGGRVWIATQRYGLFVWDGSEMEPIGVEENLAASALWDLAPDNGGGMWVGTNGRGAFRYGPGKVRRISSAEGLANDSVWQVLVDRRDRVWFYTNRGLNRLDGDTLVHFDEGDGLIDLEGSLGAALEDSLGNAWFGTGKGLMRFVPSLTHTVNLAPPAVIESASARGTDLATDQFQTLARDDNSISFAYSGLTFRDEDDTTFRYRLRGLSEQWSERTAERQISYASLPAGRYTFEVEAWVDDELHSTVPASFAFEVQPGITETVWFRLSMALLLSAAICALTWLRLRGLKEDRRRLARSLGERTREAELHLREREVAEAANRAKSDFLARMSHEIRTPINGVLGMTELLLQTALTEQQKGFGRTIRRSAGTLLDLVNDVLDISKIEAGKLEIESVEFDLWSQVDDVVDVLAQRAQRKGLELICDIKPEVPAALRGDPVRLRQVLINLVDNAIKFTDEGEVIVTLALEKERGDRLQLRVTVEDTGIGIPASTQAHIFDSFAQADTSTTRRFGGSGLGLGIARQLVEAMDGEIGVDSEEGSGSTFWFTVWLSRQGLAAAPVGDQPVLAGFRVLVVDDSATNRRILEAQLGGWGVESSCAASGDRALQLLRRAEDESQRYDLVLLDLNMKGMNGLELVAAIDDEDRIASLPVVMLTSAGVHLDDEEVRSLGIRECLAKPVRRSLLAAAMQRILRPDERAGQAAEQADPPLSTFVADVLLVEDSRVNRDVAKGLLESLGCSVQAACSGEAALKAAGERSFDLIFMDCEMPVLDGFATTHELLRRAAEDRVEEPTIIALTANAMAGYRERCLDSGMADYLSKPFSRADLHAVLGRWLEPGDGDAADPGSASAAADPAGKSANRDTASADEAAVIDTDALARIREIGAERYPGVLQELIENYIVESEELLVALRDALRRGDSDDLRIAAHTLKSASGMLGATQLAELCKRLEARAAAGVVPGSEAELDVFSQERDAVVAELGRICDRERSRAA